MTKRWWVLGGFVVALVVVYFAAKPDYWDLVQANTVCFREQSAAGDVASQDACTQELHDGGQWRFHLKYNVFTR